jgi:hypothetical protein
LDNSADRAENTVADSCTRELADIAQGDKALAEVLRISLRQLARGSPNPLLREMAREVLAGRVSLREAATSDQYGRALFDKYDRFWRRLQQYSVEEQERLARSGKKTLERVKTKLEEDN